MKKKEVIVLFSGGKDSFLATCKLIEDGFKTYLVTFENGCGLKAENAKNGVDRIAELYGKEKSEFLGVINVSGIWREFFLPFFNMKPSEILQEYGELNVSQFHCLTCRTAMYIWTIFKAKQLEISFIADGAREDQAFVIELPIMIEQFKILFKKFDIEFLLPVYNLNSDWELKNSLLVRGFLPKTIEPQCLLGVPLRDNSAPTLEIQNAVLTFYKKIIECKIPDLIKKYANIITTTKSEF